MAIMVPTCRAFRISGNQASSSTTPRRSFTERKSGLPGSASSTETVPLSGRSSPVRRRMVVDLPAPFSPTRPRIQPLGKVKFTSRSSKSPRQRLTCHSSSALSLIAHPPSAGGRSSPAVPPCPGRTPGPGRWLSSGVPPSPAAGPPAGGPGCPPPRSCPSPPR